MVFPNLGVPNKYPTGKYVEVLLGIPAELTISQWTFQEFHFFGRANHLKSELIKSSDKMCLFPWQAYFKMYIVNHDYILVL